MEEKMRKFRRIEGEVEWFKVWGIKMGRMQERRQEKRNLKGIWSESEENKKK